MKRQTTFTCLLLAVSLLAPLSMAQQEGDTMEHTLTITAHDDGAENWFEIEGMDGRNPELTLQPGATYNVTVRNEGQIPHNINMGTTIGETSEFLDAGDEQTMTFTVPADASGEEEYYCELHPVDMRGALRFGEAPTNGEPPVNGEPVDEEPEEADTPGLGVVALVGVLGAGALALRRK